MLKSDAVAKVLELHTTAAGGIDVKVDNSACGGRPYSPCHPCEVCQSTLPPLLLSVIAHCLSCGKRKRLAPDKAGGGAQEAAPPCCEQVSE